MKVTSHTVTSVTYVTFGVTGGGTHIVSDIITIMHKAFRSKIPRKFSSSL